MRIALVALLLFSANVLAAKATEPFPFGAELMLDAAPLPGSKRIPMLEIDDDGSAAIDLWCGSLRAQATVGDDLIAIVPGQIPTDLPAAPCEPDRQSRDAALVAALAQVSKWRRDGDLVEFSGTATLRFRLMTN